MGIMHALYGVGAMCAPLVSTQFARFERWSFVYLVHIGLTLINIVLQILAFRFRSQEGTSPNFAYLIARKLMLFRLPAGDRPSAA